MRPATTSGGGCEGVCEMKVKVQIVIEYDDLEEPLRVFLHIPPKRYNPELSKFWCRF